MPEKIREALKLAVKPGTTTSNLELQAAMAELEADDRRDAMLAATPMGREILADKRKDAAKFAGDMSPAVKTMLASTSLGRSILSERSAL
jgi:ribosomal protein L34